MADARIRGHDFRESSGSQQEKEAQKLLKRRWQEVGHGRFVGPSQERVAIDDLFASLETDYRPTASIPRYAKRRLYTCVKRLEASAPWM